MDVKVLSEEKLKHPGQQSYVYDAETWLNGNPSCEMIIKETSI